MAGKTSPENGGYVLGVVPISNKCWSNAMDDHNRIFAQRGDVFDELVAAGPEGEVAAVAFVVVYVDKTFSRVGIDEYNGCGVLLLDEVPNLGVGVVVGYGFEAGVVLFGLPLQGDFGGDEIGVFD